MKNLGNIAGWYDVAGQYGSPRNVVDQDQILHALSDDDIRTLVDAARDESRDPMEHRRQNPVVKCEPSVSISSPGEQLEVPALGLVPRVMGVASWSPALPVGSQSTPPSARVQC